MGHYLSDMETSDEHLYRVHYRPMLERLRLYRAERERGLAHTAEWNERMERELAEVTEAGFTL